MPNPAQPWLQPPTAEQAKIVDAYHVLWYRELRRWRDCFWQGVSVMKCPNDLIIYAEIIHKTRPDLIIELGTSQGGSALFFAQMQEINQIKDAQVFTVDVRPELASRVGRHPAIRFYCGPSVDPKVVRMASKAARKARRVMVVSDSDHTYSTTFNEMELYGPLVTPGCYLVVEDTNIGLPPIQSWRYRKSPARAVAKYLTRHPEFERDARCERFLLTFNPGGWLRRKAR